MMSLTKKSVVRFWIGLMIVCAWQPLNAQIDVVWNQIANANGVIGTVPGTTPLIGVNAVLLPGGNPVFFNSPAANGVNLNAPNPANTFSTVGPNQNDPSQSLCFQFTQPVIVTRFTMADIDRGGIWDDSFVFANGFTFAQAVGTNCIAFANGVIAGNEIGGNAEFATWTCTQPTTAFTLNYSVTAGNTHAYLAYYLQVVPVPTMPVICQNYPSPAFPAIGQITGTWDQPFIDTSTPGNFTYTFTPNAGQVLTCPIALSVVVQNCCQPFAVLQAPIDNMDNNSPDSISYVEREETITATNIIGVGNLNFEDGVVYHAGHFIEMLPGFTAVLGSQFVAEPIGCWQPFDYRFSASAVTELAKEENSPDILSGNANPDLFVLAENDVESTIEIVMINCLASNVTVNSLDGKQLHASRLDNMARFSIPVYDFPTGVYILTVTNNLGEQSVQKFIRK